MGYRAKTRVGQHENRVMWISVVSGAGWNETATPHILALAVSPMTYFVAALLYSALFGHDP